MRDEPEEDSKPIKSTRVVLRAYVWKRVGSRKEAGQEEVSGLQYCVYCVAGGVEQKQQDQRRH